MKLTRLSVLLMMAVPMVAFAQNSEEEQSLLGQLFVASFPIILIIVVFYFFLKVASKKTANINERILESNLAIAKELKRIADHIEKNT